MKKQILVAAMAHARSPWAKTGGRSGGEK